jgi:hypothetical protein
MQIEVKKINVLVGCIPIDRKKKITSTVNVKKITFKLTDKKITSRLVKKLPSGKIVAKHVQHIDKREVQEIINNQG